MRIEINKHKPMFEGVGIIGIYYEWKLRIIGIWIVFWAIRIKIC